MAETEIRRTNTGVEVFGSRKGPKFCECWVSRWWSLCLLLCPLLWLSATVLEHNHCTETLRLIIFTLFFDYRGEVNYVLSSPGLISHLLV